MYHIKFNFRVAAISLISLLTLSLSSIPEMVQAQQVNQVRVGLPGRRVGGGTRGDCNFGEKTLTALTPKNNLGLTAAKNPKLFFYIPQMSNSQVVEFVLNDSSDRTVYETTLKTTGAAGVTSLSLPDSAKLEIGKKYHWYFSVICNAQDRASDVSVDGWIQRVELSQSLATKLEKVTERQRAALYANANLWLETLATLAQLRYSHPDDSTIKAEWTQLLQSVGLENIALEPVHNQFPTRTYGAQ